VNAGDTVVFEVQPNAISAYIEYRFNFGEGTLTGWAREPRIEHQYKSAGTYWAQAEVQTTLRARVLTKITDKERIEVAAVRAATPMPTRTKARERITPSPEKKKTPAPNAFPWLWFLAGGLLVVVALWRFRPKNGAIPPRPTFYPHWGERPRTTGHENIGINYELHLDPDFASGTTTLETLEPRLVTAIKELP
jgi:hypothetical protein